VKSVENPLSKWEKLAIDRTVSQKNEPLGRYG